LQDDPDPEVIDLTGDDEDDADDEQSGAEHGDTSADTIILDDNEP